MTPRQPRNFECSDVAWLARALGYAGIEIGASQG